MPTDRPGPEGVYGKVVISVHPRMKVDSKHRDVGFLALSGHCTVTSLTTAYSHERTFGAHIGPVSYTNLEIAYTVIEESSSSGKVNYE